jgi:hypothetical protein
MVLARSRDKLIDRYFGVDLSWRSRVHRDMFGCMSDDMAAVP